MIAAVDKKLIYSQSKKEMENLESTWVWGQYICDFVEGVHASKVKGHILVASDYSLGGASILVQL